ncbi:hypothetical protein FOCC_FOCC007879 [Frankliniella occidentalis]|uniref:Guanine nucleotide exchange protein smcr8a isoform X1 n=1 Tax=Frankliniella occidentalis TaxID=133901 RepID=A0A6J1SL87_FRAOC|nr:guanine nucleotide exchange protein smcr8a isoform X1 [Frankliniella occidentalis]KAE8745331.1 hypothetical protein FOCC_FOCC007879 [Frankliniella occidentalis]
MAVTYADLVAFGFAYVEDNVSANFKKQRLFNKNIPTPLLSSEDMCLCEEEDFIIFAEFSEVKGPVALFTVPSYVQYDEKIDVNSFIMRIMSVDYQANPGGQFCICQDTQTLQTHVSHTRHAYVHYFTLYDLHARGFVRPLCVAYVSSNNQKLSKIFPQLRDQFLQLTETIKVNNRQHFRNEILTVLSNIKNMQASYNDTTQEKSGDNLADITSNLSIQQGHSTQQFEEFSFMLNAVEASLVNVDYSLSAVDHWHNAFTFSNESPAPKEIQDYLTLISSTSYRRQVNLHDNICMLEKQLRPIPVLSPWGIASALSLLLKILHLFGSCELSASLGHFPSISFSQSDPASKKETHNSTNAWEAIEIPEYLQLLKAISIGSVDASMPSYDDQECDQVERSSSKEATSGNEGSSSYHSFSDSPSDAVLPPSQKNSSLTSSIQASSDLSSDNALGSNQKRVVSHESVHTITNISVSSSQPECREDFHSILDSSSQNCISADTLNHSSENGVQYSSSDSSSSNGSESFHDILEALHSDDNWSIGSTEETLPLGVAWNHCLWTRHKLTAKSGHRLLKFFWTYRSAAQHVIYSILTGRTLVLTGDSSSERRVQRVMSALSPLIPPLDENGLRVLRWHQGILVSAHIASYQLIGMCIPERLSIHDMISPRDKNSVTILDVNSEQLLGPAYHGRLLAAIGNNVRDFPSDHSLLLFMESVLKGIGSKLQSYKALVAACHNELPSHACRQLELHGCDADIIRYLSKLTL